MSKESEVERTPEPPSRRHSAHSEPVNRADFDNLCNDVREIKHALVGRNPMRPDEGSMVHRLAGVEDKVANVEGALKRHAELHKGVVKLAWFCTLGALSGIGSLIKAFVMGKAPQP